MCVNCGRVAISECTGCHKVNYCSTFCQRKVRLAFYFKCWTHFAVVCECKRKLSALFLPCGHTKRVDWTTKASKKGRRKKKLLVTSDNAVVFSLQDWKDHQHICCQTSGGVAVHEDEPITTMDMDKVKWQQSPLAVGQTGSNEEQSVPLFYVDIKIPLLNICGPFSQILMWSIAILIPTVHTFGINILN